jgi:hypothetical protein
MSLGALLTADSSLGLGMPEGLSRAWKGLWPLGLSLGVPRYVPVADIVRAIRSGCEGGEGPELTIYVSDCATQSFSLSPRCKQQ